jgi:dTDP-4-dehydrorhamnose reductase
LAVTGAAGMLGRELVAAARARSLEPIPWDLVDFDLTDREAVMRALDAARPRALVHAAAWTDVDGCESDPEKAFLANGRATAHVAEACRETGARLVMVSTDYVFSGDKKEPYLESDPPGPLSIYGWSKLVGEEAVRLLGRTGAVARTAWLYADHGANFFLTMMRLAAERPELAVVDDQLGSPTFAADLAYGLIDLALSDASGTFHVTNRGAVTWNGFARAIFARAGLSVTVNAVSSSEFPRPARRPSNSVLANTRFAEVGIPPMPTWEDGLRRCLERLGQFTE